MNMNTNTKEYTDPCSRCKNGPEPSNMCLNCSDFSYGCKVHNIDPTTFNPLKLDTTETIHVANKVSKTSLYTEEQKYAVNQQLEFFNKIIKSSMEHDIPLHPAQEAFFKCIFENILKCMKSESQSKTFRGYMINE